jgi:hypothetical protein
MLKIGVQLYPQNVLEDEFRVRKFGKTNKLYQGKFITKSKNSYKIKPKNTPGKYN